MLIVRWLILNITILYIYSNCTLTTYLMLLIIYFFFIISIFHLNYWVGVNGIKILNSYILLLLVIFNFLFFYNLTGEYTIIINSTSRVITGDCKLYFISFKYSLVSYIFSAIIIQIAFFAIIFSYMYFKKDITIIRFIFLLNLFIFSMICLVYSETFITLILFWELIGISSFFLINHFYLRAITFKSAFKAFSFNKISDVCLIISALIYYSIFSTWNLTLSFDKIILMSNSYWFLFNTNINVLTVFLIMLSLAAFIKSAQIGFHVWLPDSMEAPIPASALIHSATLIAAGIFLNLKFLVFYQCSPNVSYLVIFVGAVTMLYGAISAAFQTDWKKILAYSTISNCGIFFVLNTLCSLKVSLLYFALHGFLKSFCFLCIGILVYLNRHNQELRKLGQFPLIFNSIWVLLVTSMFILAGNPIFFISFLKHQVLFGTKIINLYFLVFIKILFLFTSFFSFFYAWRLGAHLVISFNKVSKNYPHNLFRHNDVYLITPTKNYLVGKILSQFKHLYQYRKKVFRTVFTLGNLRGVYTFLQWFKIKYFSYSFVILICSYSIFIFVFILIFSKFIILQTLMSVQNFFSLDNELLFVFIYFEIITYYYFISYIDKKYLKYWWVQFFFILCFFVLIINI